ncbi:MAG: SxtJ family membrane protein [bacterium]|nr:SxtJ family membrane protein [bacterium]
MIKEIRETLQSIHPSHRQLRLFGVLLGALIVFASRTVEGADAFGGSTAGIIIAALAVALPGAIEPVWRALMALTLPIGWFVSRLILIVFFYTVFTPISLVLRIVGHDILKRRLLSSADTYWEPFEENKRPDSMGL